MKTPKKIGKAIAKKFKNWKGTTTAKGADMDEPRISDMPEDVKEVKDSLDVKEQKETANIVNKATETDTKLCEDIDEDSKDFQPIFETSEKAQNASTEQVPDVPDSPSPPGPCSRCGKGNPADEKSSKRASQPIIAGIVGVVLLVSGIASYIMKMHIIAVVGVFVGLVCIDFTLYDTLKPNTKLEKVEDIAHTYPFLKTT